MLASIFSLNVIQTALELGCIYALVALALFLSYSILNIADLSTDGCFTLGCAVACQVALTGHPFLALLAAIGLADSALIDPDEYMGTLLFAGIAIILGAIGTYQQKKGRGLSIAGLVLGGLALLISLGV